MNIKKPNFSELITPEYWMIMLTSFLIILNFGLSIFFYPNSGANSDKENIIRIEQNLTLNELANLLKEQQIISKKFTFIFVGKLFGYEKKIKTGIFTIPHGLSNFELYKIFVLGKGIKSKKITFIEGYKLSTYIKIISKNFGIPEAEINKFVKDSSLLKKYEVDNKDFEGYLMPDTYFFLANSSAEDVIQKLAREFQRYYNDNIKMYESKLRMSKREIITLASIIEGETINEQERYQVSGVYHNRLKKKMKLDADPTVKYLLKDGEKLLPRHYSINNKYNTYLNSGLPPGPICNPSRSSLLAAVKPANHNYLYFVVDPDGSGHTFSENYSAHSIAVQKYRKAKRMKRL